MLLRPTGRVLDVIRPGVSLAGCYNGRRFFSPSDVVFPDGPFFGCSIGRFKHYNID